MAGSVANAFDRPETANFYRNAAEITGQLKPAEPLYLFCPSVLAARAACYLQQFPGTISYAVKANPEQRVLETLAAAGLQNYDVASLDEVRRVSEYCPGATLHFNNPIKAEDAVAEAYLRFGVRSFAVDEMSELAKIRRCTGGDPDVIYTVRFKLDHASAAYDFGSKFGADTATAVQLLQAVKSLGARAAVTFHPGSQCTDPGMYERYLQAAAGIIAEAGVAVEFVNVGGGFPEHYAGTALPPLEEYFAAISRARDSYFTGPVKLMCEPGRGIVASCVSLLTRVIHVRNCGKNLFVNDGVYGGMQEQSLVDITLPVRVWREGRILHTPDSDYHVFGPTCDPVDRLSRATAMPQGIRTGDYIEFGLLGAYGSATTTRFNGFNSSTYVNVLEATPFVPC
ncbi:type III PLP-dependent enzyme [Seongchinamella sediminis]|uniref:ornithine decarboxylase n=1 Tax=Seongchinamella sediminis TaxID=2283635 RepID=A0A3L7E363_9GAMM|nr:type III PLP-dependent enzyme [Seongchinamella sediminis]RLQ22821.1 type III PLP-dependent enzyme [Seongchinamella sediminis]